MLRMPRVLCLIFSAGDALGGAYAEGDRITGFENLVGGSGVDDLMGDSGGNVLLGLTCSMDFIWLRVF